VRGDGAAVLLSAEKRDSRPVAERWLLELVLVGGYKCLEEATDTPLLSNMASLSETEPARFGSDVRSLLGLLLFSSRALIQLIRSLTEPGCFLVAEIERGAEVLAVGALVDTIEGVS
jgi:hypothetical protein